MRRRQKGTLQLGLQLSRAYGALPFRGLPASPLPTGAGILRMKGHPGQGANHAGH